MIDLLTPVLGLEPTGPEATALCAAMFLLLALLVLGGFALLRRTERTTRGRHTQPVPRELGLLALWRLNRNLVRRAHPEPHPSGGSTSS